jgi:hypothetical protein
LNPRLSRDVKADQAVRCQGVETQLAEVGNRGKGNAARPD